MAGQTATTQLRYVPDWKARGTDRLLVNWDKQRIRALVEALCEGIQTQEDQTFDLLVSTGLDEATGDALDQWGEIVGEQRGTLTDSEYRQFILVRMLVNRSAGTIDEMLQILDLATQPNVGVFHQSLFPAGFQLTVDRESFMSESLRRRVGRLLEDARPGGRHMTVIESLIGGFGFSADPSAQGYNVGPYSRLITSVS